MRGVESFWHPYIATLPKDADFYHMPFYWYVIHERRGWKNNLCLAIHTSPCDPATTCRSDEDLAELHGSVLFMDVLELRRSVADGWQRVYNRVLRKMPHVFPPEVFRYI